MARVAGWRKRLDLLPPAAGRSAAPVRILGHRGASQRRAGEHARRLPPRARPGRRRRGARCPALRLGRGGRLPRRASWSGSPERVAGWRRRPGPTLARLEVRAGPRGAAPGPHPAPGRGAGGAAAHGVHQRRAQVRGPGRDARWPPRRGRCSNQGGTRTTSWCRRSIRAASCGSCSATPGSGAGSCSTPSGGSGCSGPWCSRSSAGTRSTPRPVTSPRRTSGAGMRGAARSRCGPWTTRKSPAGSRPGAWTRASPTARAGSGLRRAGAPGAGG